MATNIVCSDTYIDAFSRLDKKIQKKSLETIRLMQMSLRSDGLKIEKLNTRLDFKSVRVTQDFRAIFTQSGNTVLLVYIDHHNDAYLWATKRLQGFDPAGAKPAYEYFEQAMARQTVGQPAPAPAPAPALDTRNRKKSLLGFSPKLLYFLSGVITGIIMSRIILGIIIAAAHLT